MSRKQRCRGFIGPAWALFAAITCIVRPASGQEDKVIHWSAAEKPLANRIDALRGLPDDARSATTADLALKIRSLPMTRNKLRLATSLAGLATEGNFGHATLQRVATTLAMTLREKPLAGKEPQESGAGKSGGGKSAAVMLPDDAYRELAELARYEHVDVSLNGDEHYRAALDELQANDARREHLDFTLKDLSAKAWRLSALRGKVVLINFWATWCPPCRKELPDLEALYARFASKGLVVLGISDEDAAKINPFVRKHRLSFPVLLDPNGSVNQLFAIKGIPKTFVYDRTGHLVAQAIDMRTQEQLLAMLNKAGLE